MCLGPQRVVWTVPLTKMNRPERLVGHVAQIAALSKGERVSLHAKFFPPASSSSPSLDQTHCSPHPCGFHQLHVRCPLSPQSWQKEILSFSPPVQPFHSHFFSFHKKAFVGLLLSKIAYERLSTSWLLKNLCASFATTREFSEGFGVGENIYLTRHHSIGTFEGVRLSKVPRVTGWAKLCTSLSKKWGLCTLLR